MGVILLIALIVTPFLLGGDPAPGPLQSRPDSRALECERLSAEIADRRYPGLIKTADPRGEYVERTALVCAERLMRPGLRAERDEAVLSTLSDRADELAGAASDLRPDLAERTWLVEAHYPSAPVTEKIDFAAKGALAAQGLRVSDRAPRLAAGDVDVLLRMAPSDAWPAACQRYAATGSLGADDALLAVMILDPRETALHAGICEGGRWVWVK